MLIFITAMGHATVEGGSRGIVMNIAETKEDVFALIIFDRSNYSIYIGRAELFDLRVNADLGLTSLMTSQIQRCHHRR
ncbi:MAG: hypothetical protein IPJ47_22840 [Anaerolineales bacterium]|nr:hypothetical protein [Anaerolineales bacterium]